MKQVATESLIENRVTEPMIAFEEIQRFRQWWLWFLVVGSTTAVVVPFLFLLASGGHAAEKPLVIIVYCLISFCMICILLILPKLVLRTSIDPNLIRMQYSIFGNKNIPWSDVETVNVVNYGFVGYGLRLSRNHGTVYNVDGKYGLFITLKSGKKLTIGTQKKEELKGFLVNIGRGDSRNH